MVFLGVPLPMQSIAVQKDVTVPTTRKKFTCDNLIIHIILFITSTQIHIFPEIGIDVIRFLDLYLGILNAGIMFGGTDGECMNIVCNLTTDMRLDLVQATSTSAISSVALSRILHTVPLIFKILQSKLNMAGIEP